MLEVQETIRHHVTLIPSTEPSSKRLCGLDAPTSRYNGATNGRLHAESTA
jgi:hypothetical protein